MPRHVSRCPTGDALLVGDLQDPLKREVEMAQALELRGRDCSTEQRGALQLETHATVRKPFALETLVAALR